MIIGIMLFILNSEFSVSDELFDSTMIIITDAATIWFTYYGAGRGCHHENKMCNLVLSFRFIFIVAVINCSGDITCRELKV